MDFVGSQNTPSGPQYAGCVMFNCHKIKKVRLSTVVSVVFALRPFV